MPLLTPADAQFLRIAWKEPARALRRLKLRPGRDVDAAPLCNLMDVACVDIRAAVGN